MNRIPISHTVQALALVAGVLSSMPSHAAERVEKWPAWQQQRVALERLLVRDEFRIFYTLTGPDALPEGDRADSDHDGVPDKIQNIALQLVAARRCLVEVLGLRHPLQSPRYAGRVKFIEVNVWALEGKNGSAGDAIVNFHRPGDPPEGVEVVTIDLAAKLPARNLSPAHELFHVFQNGYAQFKNAWYYEGMARWSESLLGVSTGTLGTLPADAAALDGLFQQSYDASRFWLALARATDPAGTIRIPPDLAALRYIGSPKPIIEDDAFTGAALMKALLEAFDREDDAASKADGLDPLDWKEARQRVPENNARLWSAVRRAARRFSSVSLPALTTLDGAHGIRTQNGLALTLLAEAQDPGASWERLTDDEAAAAGWSRAKLAEARDYSTNLNTEAVFIVTRGKVLESWGAVERKLNVHSIRKSFLSALCGIRVAEGKIHLDATMADLGIDDNEPALTEVERRATVHDLLKARSGVYHPALYETATMKARRPARHSHAPGTFWYYNNWDFNALGAIYEQRTGAGIYEDFQRLIAAPLGMEDYEAADGKYFTGADSIHRAYPFRMTARDMARFGLLFLRGGEWNGKQVVPAAWVKDSVTSYSDAGTSGGYGYLWWVERGGIHFANVTVPEGSYSARGSGGHYILVVPKLDLVIVHRVNTDISDRRVESSEFGELVRRILLAYEPPPVKGAAAPALDTLLPWLMSKHRVPGAAVVGIENRRVAWEKYLGAREAGKGAPVDADTVFEAASMTKPLCAYAAMKLVEQGKLDLDRPLDSYLPEPYLPEQPLSGKITARMALTHTGGFPNWRPKGGALKVMHEPGAAFRYSGEGILFLQRAMERITGEDYELFIQRTLLQPQGMTHSSHVWQPSFTNHAAAGHDSTGKVKADRRLYRQPNAAYSLYCTPRDYAAFVLEMMNPDRSAAHSISAASLRAMLTPASPPTGRESLTRRDSPGRGEVRYGLGWAIEPTASGPRIRHSGSNGTGFRSHVEFDPARGHGILIMTNGEGGAELWKELLGHIGIP